MVEIVQKTISVVVVGSMNPAIFQPEWLRSHKIIGEKETDAATDGVEVVHRDVTILNLTNMKLTVDASRFTLVVLQEPFEKAKDFVVSCFSLLGQTPVTALGINRDMVIHCSDKEAWHKFGDYLAPKQPWSTLLGKNEMKERNGGLRTMIMERTRRFDKRPGYIRVSLEALEHSQSDARINYNDHYDLSDKGRQVSADSAVKILEANWDECAKRSAEVFESLEEFLRKNEKK